ncbi:uncharacterized protein LOC118431976 [Branchiostoma floridae]|uniref:Uncharacterized protein LOC118431976 n=1 Tax=Branchiostoma floridae TaxID=7739 RepID=A0A9J7MDN3_BRAFL|nr:uncharacterized protein LOC118431976 [Branchiostoma floridae]
MINMDTGSHQDPVGVLIDPESPPSELISAMKRIAERSLKDPVARGSFCEDCPEGPSVVLTRLTDVLRTTSSPQLKMHACATLGALAHGDRQVREQVCQLGVLAALTGILREKQEEHGRLLPDQLKLQEQTAALVRKLTHQYKCQLDDLRQSQILSLLLQFCDVYGRDTRGKFRHAFPAESRCFLRRLTTGKQLVGRVTELRKLERKMVMQRFNRRHVIGLCEDRVYLCELYDTTTTDDVLVSAELVKAGLAWVEPEDVMYPSNKGSEGIEDDDRGVWKDMFVTCWVDGSHFWAHVGGDDTHGTIKRIQDEIKSAKSRAEPLIKCPEVGDMVVAPPKGNQDESKDDLPGSPGTTGYRAVVTEVKVGMVSQVRVHAVDYGFDTDVSWILLTKVPLSVSDVPPQATACVLRSVIPPPPSVPALCSVLGTLCNLTQDQCKVSDMIVEKEGLSLVTKLCYSPVDEVCRLSASVLLNLARSSRIRNRMGLLGAPKALLDMCQRYVKDDAILEAGIGALRNLMYQCMPNRWRLVDLKGFMVLMHIYKTSKNESIKLQALGAIKNLVGEGNTKGDPDFTLKYNGSPRNEDGYHFLKAMKKESKLEGDREIDKKSSPRTSGKIESLSEDAEESESLAKFILNNVTKAKRSRTASEPASRSKGSPKSGDKKSESKTTSARSQNRSRSKSEESPKSISPRRSRSPRKSPEKSTQESPTRKKSDRKLRKGEVHPDPTEVSLGTDTLNSFFDDLSDAGSVKDTVAAKEFLQTVLSPDIPSSRPLSEEPKYVQGFVVDFVEDTTHDIRPQTSVDKISITTIGRITCAFLNSGRGGTLYLGIKPDYTVRGIEITRHERDEFRLGIDRLMTRMIPPVKHDKYQVVFHPVISRSGCDSPDTRKCVEDLHVIEVQIRPSFGVVYGTWEDRCYVRMNTKNTKLTHQDVRELVLNEEEQRYQAEVESLQSEIQRLQTQLRSPSRDNHNKDSPQKGNGSALSNMASGVMQGNSLNSSSDRSPPKEAISPSSPGEKCNVS